MVARKYKLISLFSGAGGMDLGFRGDFEFLGRRYERLPFEIVFAIDVDPRAARAIENAWVKARGNK